MIEKFLKAKHWQLFLLVFGIPVIFYFVIMGSMFATMIKNPHPDPSFMVGYMKFFPFIIIAFSAVLYGWQWSVAIGLQSKVPQNIKMKVTRFKTFFFIPLVYILCIVTVMSWTMGNIMQHAEVPDVRLFAWFMAIVVPMHLFSMFCIFYSLYFIAKTFKTVELQREVTFSDFVGEFFLIWFYPIGIWIIQPKINKMIA
jgi:hypothetical protein